MPNERVDLYDKDDKLFDIMYLPPNFMEGEPQRVVIAQGRKFVEGGKDSIYGKGEFGEVTE